MIADNDNAKAEKVQTLHLTSAEVGRAVLAFLEQYLGHGSNDPGLLLSDLGVMYTADGSPYTSDPASWSDWLRGVWTLRNISASNHISTRSDVEVVLPSGASSVVSVRALQPSQFGTGVEELDLGSPVSSAPHFSEVTGYVLLVAFVAWSGFPIDVTVSGLIQTLKAIQNGTAAPAIANSWKELLA